MAKKTPGDIALAELDIIVTKLETEDRELLAEIIKLETIGASPRPPGPGKTDGQIVAEAEALIGGDIGAVKIAKAPDDVRLFDLRERQKLVRKAIELARDRAWRKRIDASAQIAADMTERWNAKLRALVECYDAPKQIAADMQRLVAEWNSRAAGAPHPFQCAIPAEAAVNATMAPDSAVYRLVHAARLAGII